MNPFDWREIGDARLAVQAFTFGGTPLGGRHVYSDVSEQGARDLVIAAFEAGLRCFDTAPFYGLGQGEERMGRALASLPRNEIVVSSKVGRFLVPCSPMAGEDGAPYAPVFDYSYEAAFRQLDESLERLMLDRLDIVYIHDVDSPASFEQARKGSFRALRELRVEGKTSAIGAGVSDLKSAISFAEQTDIDVLMLACRYTLLEQPALEVLLPLCERRGIKVLVAAPFNSGILATGAVQHARHNYGAADAVTLDRVRRLQRVCEDHNVDLRAAALQFPLAHPAVAGVVVGSRNPAELFANLENVRRTISRDFWRALRQENLIDPAASIPA